MEKRARIYGRYSSLPQERGDSKRRQIEGAKLYADRNGISIIGNPYFDEAVSGKNGLNLEKEFGRLLLEVQEGETLLVEDLSRIGRQNPFILGKLLYDIVQKGVTVIAWSEQKIIDKDNIDSLDTQFSVFTGAAVGHSENKRKIDRLIATTGNALNLGVQGIQSGTLRKYLPECFIWNGKLKAIEVDENKAKTIRLIFDLYASGKGRTQIAQYLNTHGVATIYKRTKQQIGGSVKSWLETTIRKILLNESYAGVLNVKGRKITCIPSIVSHETWEKCQSQLARNQNRAGKLTGRINNIFAGLAFCKHCHGTINVTVCGDIKTDKRWYYYRCKNARLHNCPQRHVMLKSPVVEPMFFDALFGGSPENHFQSQTAEMNQKIEFLKLQIEKCDKAIHNLYDLVESGDQLAKERIIKRRAEKEQYTEELKYLKGSVTEQNSVPAMIEEIAGIVGAAEQRQFYKNYIERIKVKLSNNDLRRKLVTMLPTLFEKLIFDCNAGYIQPITKDGKTLPLIYCKPMGEIVEML